MVDESKIVQIAKKVSFWAGLIMLLASLGVFTFIRKYIGLPAELEEYEIRTEVFKDSVRKQLEFNDKILQSIHYDVLSHEQFNEMVLLLGMSVTKDDNKDYYVVFNEGAVIFVDLRKSDYGEDWAFLEDGTMFPAIESKLSGKPTIIPNDGRPSTTVREITD